MDAFDAVRDKVLAIFTDLVGERAKRLDGAVSASEMMERLERVLQEAGFEGETPYDIAFDMADWNWEAAFVVALHLFPEQFSDAEIEAGLHLFLAHAPYHVARAAQLMEAAIEGMDAEEDEGA